MFEKACDNIVKELRRKHNKIVTYSVIGLLLSKQRPHMIKWSGWKETFNIVGLSWPQTALQQKTDSNNIGYSPSAQLMPATLCIIDCDSTLIIVYILAVPSHLL